MKKRKSENDWEWVNFLREESKGLLNEVLDKTKFHRAAYSEAKDVKIAQLWCAVLELKRDVENLRKDVEKMFEPFKGIIEFAEEEKRKAIERVIAALIKESEEREKKVKEIAKSLTEL